MIQWIIGIVFAAGVVLLLIGAVYSIFTMFSARAIVICTLVSVAILGLSVTGMPKAISAVPVLLAIALMTGAAVRLNEMRPSSQTEPAEQSAENSGAAETAETPSDAAGLQQEPDKAAAADTQKGGQNEKDL